ncbi:MAG: acetoin utilization deacetylase AcuC-like enzyme [Parasphingorhabdus sp.]|jgi:acetoin utilization deacetylase AcuC-like enzyme
MPNTAFLYDPRFLQHDTGQGHPERSSRLSHAIEFLQQRPYFDSLQQVAPAPCAEQWIETIHSGDYINRTKQACNDGVSYIDSPDVAVCSSSWDVANLAVGGVLAIADAVIGGEVQNGFAMIRPPGHHAEHDTALGFCLFNNVAITARYLQAFHGLERILILDWDVHHGNGTQHSFESDDSVMYISLHQYPFYPGSGAWSETGIGKGLGATVNCPMNAGAGNAEYEQAFKERIFPAIHSFKPDAVLLSAGFDAHGQDPLGAINLTTDFYHWMTVRMKEIADQYCQGRIISMLEGGYDLLALASCIDTHIETLSQHD